MVTMDKQVLDRKDLMKILARVQVILKCKRNKTSCEKGRLRDVSMVSSICCSSRGLGFNTQHPNGTTHQHETPVSGDPISSFDIPEYDMYIRTDKHMNNSFLLHRN